MITSQICNIRFYGSKFSPKKFQEETGFLFSKCYEIGDKIGNSTKYSTLGSAVIRAEDGEYLETFLKRVKKSKHLFNKENLKKYEIEEVHLNIDHYYLDQCNNSFSKKEIKLMASLDFIQDVWTSYWEEKKRIKKQLVSLSRSYYERQINFLAQQLLQARKDANLSLAQVADHDFISEKELEKLEKGSQQVEFLLLKELAKLYKKPLDFFYE